MGKMKEYLLDKIYDAILPFSDLEEVDINYEDVDDQDPEALRKPLMHVCGKCNAEYEEFLDLKAHFQDEH